MNDPQAVAWLNAAKAAGACGTRLTPYEAKAARNDLKVSDIAPDDAIWILAAVKDVQNVAALKVIAKRSVLGSLVT
jgi:hypothetical protein